MATTQKSRTLSPKDLYLIFYNGLCCAGWNNVLLWCLHGVTFGGEAPTLTSRLAGLYNDSHSQLPTMLAFSQMAAIFEIVHAQMRLVRSPVIVTALQVSSRLVSLVAITYSEAAQNQWGAGIMMLSWSLVEVPRYAFYVAAILTGDATKKTPYVLFWLRYSLFAILYPTGILGELTVFWYAARDESFQQMFSFSSAAFVVYAWIVPIVYIVGSPFMILNMAANRKSAFKKRFARPPPPPRGLCWPITEHHDDNPALSIRGSTETNKAIVAAAVAVANPSKAQEIVECRNWRFQYVKHYKRGLIQEQCASSATALAMAQAGLNKAYELFEFVGPDGTTVSFQQAMLLSKNSSRSSTSLGPAYCTGFIKGTATAPKSTVLEVPYKGQTLSGVALQAQVQQWVNYGTIEPSAGHAIQQCIQHPEWLQDLSKRYFVLLGAGSAMGPFLVMMALGANVIAIDLDRPQIWKRLIGIARQSSGSLTFPLSAEQTSLSNDDELCQAAGCNLFTDTPRIRDWLVQVYPGQPLTVGCYAYLDGALHVQVSLAMDAICRDLTEQRIHTSLAYLCTPTDLHHIPREAYDAQNENWRVYSQKLFCKLMTLLGRGSMLRKNTEEPVMSANGDAFYYVNGMIVAQGPNYALAKRMQHWRAVIARSKGCTVSSNVAPSTSTVSVVHNRTFACAYEGMPYFAPFEIFAPETSNAVMSAILLYDLNDQESVANPSQPLTNPYELFANGSFHGGVWRCAYEADSIGAPSVLLYFGRVVEPYLSVGVAGVVAVTIVWIMTMYKDLEA